MVEEHGEGSWSSIAKSFAGRIGKQCRERWHNQLRPDIRRDAWTDGGGGAAGRGPRTAGQQVGRHQQGAAAACKLRRSDILT